MLGRTLISPHFGGSHFEQGKNKSKGTELCKPITWMGEEGVQIGNGNKQGSGRTFLKCNTNLEKEAGVGFFSNNLG